MAGRVAPLLTPLGDRKSRDDFLKSAGTGTAGATTTAVSAAAAATSIASGTDRLAPAIYTGSPARVSILGATVADDGSGFYLKPTNMTAGFTGNPWVVPYLIRDSALHEILFKDTPSSRHRIRIDGVLKTTTWTTPPGSTNNYVRMLVTLPDAGVHRIDIEAGPDFRFGGVRVATGGTIAPVRQPAHRGMFFGNSLIEPTGATAQDGMGHISLRLLGFEDAWQSGYGGSGYTQVGANGVQKNFLTRIADITNYSPNLVIVQDQDSSSTLATFQADVAAFWPALRTALPTATLIAVGNINRGQVSPTAYDTAINSAVTAVGGFFIPMESVITGSGMAGAKANDGGNADFYWGGSTGTDAGHPNVDGHRFLAEVIAEKIGRALATQRVVTAA